MTTLDNIGGNFHTNKSALEAWDFRRRNSSGNFVGLVQGRVLTITGVSTVPIQVVSGNNDLGIYQPNTCTQHLAMAQNDGINALSNSENYLTYSVWWKRVAATGISGFGITDGTGYQCAASDLDTVTSYLYDETGGEAAYIETGVVPTVGAWNHGVFQYSYDGSGDGVNMECWVNGTQYTTVAGTPTTMFPNFAGTIPFVLGNVEGVVCQQIVWASLIIRKSAVAWLDSTAVAQLYNGGRGINFALYGQRRRKAKRLLLA